MFPKSSDAVEYALAFLMVSFGAVALAIAVAIVVGAVSEHKSR